MKRALYVTLFLTILTLITIPNADAQTIQTVGKCDEIKDYTRFISKKYPPNWTIIVFCTQTKFENAERALKIEPSRGAFTILNLSRTYIDGSAILRDKLRELLDHEFLHIQCMCRLDEDMPNTSSK